MSGDPVAFNNTSAVDICSCVYLITYQALHSPTFRPHAHRQNENLSLLISYRYTDYFDSEGKRIAKKDKVIYRNKIYSLYKEEKNWYLVDNNITEKIKLQEAVIDKEGKIKVYFYGMGERI